MNSVAYTSTATAPRIDARGTMTLSATAVSGANGKGSMGGPGKSPLRHIDDLVSVSVDIDPHTPLRKVLEIGDAHMRQATTFNDFKRPDLALQEYIKAFTIAVDKVPRHKDYPSMKSDRGDLNRLYHALKLKITTNDATFEKIKEDIKHDNQLSGVQPTTSAANHSSSNLPDRTNISSNTSQQTQIPTPTDSRNNHVEDEHNTSSTDGAVAGHRQKPVIQPKPQALHGKVIQQPQKSPQEDLADRFARLRVAKKNAPTLSGECSPAQSLPSLDTSVAVMPKVPQAIYNPARGTVTSEVANLPSSSPRGMFSRSKSMTTTPSVPTRMLPEIAIGSSREQFVAANTYGAPRPKRAPKRARISEDDTITPTALASLLGQSSPGAQSVDILIIDVRDRESFDEGHIRSHKTICVEPEILMRESISAEDIVDSMVLAPTTETLAMEQRDKVDLVVIYDDDSTSIPARVTGSSSEMVLYNIRQALSYYSYSRPLKADPKLLRGGLDAWIYQFGEESLEASDTVAKHAHRSKPRNGGKRRSRVKSRPLGSDEVEQFETFIQQNGDEMLNYVRSRDNFVRRQPNSTGAPESMTHPLLQKYRKSQPREEDYLDSFGPAPPRRPAPAVPKTRFSGLESTDDDDSSGGALGKMAVATSAKDKDFYITGLANGCNNCFANSAIQAFLASPRLADEFISPNFPRNWRFVEDAEPTQPQLLSKIMANTLQWMHKRQFPAMKLGLLMHYLRAVHTGYVNGNRLWVFGDGQQHDSEEFLGFVLDQLRMETSMTRKLHAIGRPNTALAKDPIVGQLIDAFWKNALDKYSLVHKYFEVFSANEMTCDRCGAVSITHSSDLQFAIGINPDSEDLNTLLRRERVDHVCDYKHDDWCGTKGGMRRSYIIRFPPILRILFRRTEITPSGGTGKHFRGCHFPENLDMSAYSFDPVARKAAADIIPAPLNDGLMALGRYELYAIVVHSGTGMNSGHYWTYVRQKSDAPYDKANHKDWLSVNDNDVTPLRGAEWANTLSNLRQIPDKNTPTPAQLFYRRIDVPYETPPSGQDETGPGI
ncbi:cysteine proteinase [Hypoxylon sp. FL1150]|nr:cysteine proteinase [Hypoxylon sp. FL1150]